MELEKNNFSKQAKAFEEKYSQEKAPEKDKHIVKLKGKISKLNKRTSNIKKVAVVNFKESAKFKYEKGVAIDKARKGMVWTFYKKSLDFDPSIL